MDHLSSKLKKKLDEDFIWWVEHLHYDGQADSYIEGLELSDRPCFWPAKKENSLSADHGRPSHHWIWMISTSKLGRWIAWNSHILWREKCNYLVSPLGLLNNEEKNIQSLYFDRHLCEDVTFHQYQQKNDLKPRKLVPILRLALTENPNPCITYLIGEIMKKFHFQACRLINATHVEQENW